MGNKYFLVKARKEFNPMQEKIYDNSNIAESYAGATTPLTFSFVRYVYQEVYQHFSEMMGVNKNLIKNNKNTFECMVEFIGYRIYYNHSNWYKMLSFFPGYKFSSEFMEKMMGVEKHRSINNENLEQNFFIKYFLHLPGVIIHATKILLNFSVLKWRIIRFNNHFDKVYTKLNESNFDELELRGLKKLYEEADKRLLSHWRVPIANDFAVMVSAGLADKLFKKWLDSENSYSYMRADINKPLITLDPSNKIIQIVKYINKDSNVKGLFLNKNEKEILTSLHNIYPFHQVTCDIDVYLKNFGSRIPNELKLESETLSENPENIIKLIKILVQNKLTYNKLKKVQLIEKRLKLSLVKLIFLNWLLSWAGNSIRIREEARFRRTLIFGFVRKIFLKIGERLRQKKIILDTRDIFFLTIEEIFNIIDGKNMVSNHLLLIEQRKRQFNKWQNIELPRHFETSKNINDLEKDLINGKIRSERTDQFKLRGRVVSRPNSNENFAGVALTLKNFDPNANFSGKILVTCQTDPGWTIIFPFLKGVVVERGGMLSHAAIVARELNIPCIVGVQQATDIIPNNSKINLDLKNGLVEKLC